MNEGKHRKYLLDSSVMRALITNTKGKELGFNVVEVE